MSLGNKETMSNNIKRLMNIKGVNASMVCSDLNISMSTFSDWCNAKTYPRIDKIELLATYFGVSKSELVEEYNSKNLHTNPPRVIKIYSRVSAGIPLEAIEDIVDYEEIPDSWYGEYFGIRVQGDSMSPRICEGDYVIVRKQSDADSGDIVIALINGSDACVKRLVKYENGLIGLLSLNPNYEPMMFDNDDDIQILGKVVENRQHY